MLVLSRKQNQKITFPNLGISVEVLRIKGNAVRVGVDAPKHVRVLREEVAAEEGGCDTASESRHALRNRLNSATLALHVAQKMLEEEMYDDAERTMSRALNEFSELENMLATGEELAEPSSRLKRRALLVEDDANERELLAGYLRMCGYEVHTVEDGLQAMRYLSVGERPDVVLLDMQMPRLDGPKTVSAIRRNPQFDGLKLIVVSGSDNHRLQVPIGERGVDRWFPKPLNPTRFVKELDEELNAKPACV